MLKLPSGCMMGAGFFTVWDSKSGLIAFIDLQSAGRDDPSEDRDFELVPSGATDFERWDAHPYTTRITAGGGVFVWLPKSTGKLWTRIQKLKGDRRQRLIDTSSAEAAKRYAAWLSGTMWCVAVVVYRLRRSARRYAITSYDQYRDGDEPLFSFSQDDISASSEARKLVNATLADAVKLIAQTTR